MQYSYEFRVALGGVADYFEVGGYVFYYGFLEEAGFAYEVKFYVLFS